MSKVEPCKSVRVTRLPCDDRYPIDIYISLLFAEASTATTTRTITTRPAAARGRDIKRKQFHSPWVHVLKIWFKRSCKADSNQTYKEESNFAGGGPVRKMPSIFPAGGGGGGFLAIHCRGCRPTLQILTQDPISEFRPIFILTSWKDLRNNDNVTF